MLIYLESSVCPFFLWKFARLTFSSLPIFQAEIGRHMIGDQVWEVYRILLDEGATSSIPRRKVEEEVWKRLMGWE